MKDELNDIITYIDENIVDPFKNSEITRQLGEYADYLKEMAKKEKKEVSLEMKKLGDNLSQMLEDYKAQKEIDHLKEDIADGIHHMGKTAKKVAKDVKEMVDDE